MLYHSIYAGYSRSDMLEEMVRIFEDSREEPVSLAVLNRDEASYVLRRADGRMEQSPSYFPASTNWQEAEQPTPTAPVE